MKLPTKQQGPKQQPVDQTGAKLSISFKVFGRPNCSYCDNTIKLLERGGYEFEYFNIEVYSNMVKFKELFPTARTVPQIVSPHGQIVGGYDDLVEWLTCK